MCHRCGARAIKPNRFQACQGCHHAKYCGKSCQRADWQTGGHKAVCKKLQSAVTEAKLDLAGRPFALNMFLADALQVIV